MRIPLSAFIALPLYSSRTEDSRETQAAVCENERLPPSLTLSLRHSQIHPSLLSPLRQWSADGPSFNRRPRPVSTSVHPASHPSLHPSIHSGREYMHAGGRSGGGM